MGKSEILTSQNRGNWIEENIITCSDIDENKLEVFNATIKKYTSELDGAANETNRNVYGKTGVIPKNERLNLILPVLNPQFDISKTKNYSQKTQNWKGIIEEIKDDCFIARLEDLSKGGTDEIAEFEIDDISPDDIKFVKRGASFYWSVGLFMLNGQREKKSTIRFQRLILLDEEDINKSYDNVKLKYSNLKTRTIDYKPS
jgi:hypothetical protein